MSIQIMDIDDLDFRHLALFETLIRKGSVTDAARQLDLPQSSASHGLARLRAAFDDKLLVRARGGMEPTPKAVALLPIVQQALQLKVALKDGGPDFTPDRLTRQFVIASSDLGQLIILSALNTAAGSEASNVSFKAMTLARDEMVRALESGSVDLAFGAYPELVTGIFEQTLYTERYRCFGPRSHPFIVSGELSDFLSGEHVVITTKGLAHAHRKTERALIEAIPEERIRLLTTSFFVALGVAVKNGLIVTAPGDILREIAEEWGLAWRDPPLPLPGFTVKQYWHARNQDDPAHQWLRRKVCSALSPRTRSRQSQAKGR